jgi:hypothetical protein
MFLKIKEKLGLDIKMIAALWQQWGSTDLAM